MKEYAAIDFCSTERYTQWDGRQVIFYSVLRSSTPFYSVFERLTSENRLWATFQYHFDNYYPHMYHSNTLINLTLITLTTYCDTKRSICNHTFFTFAILYIYLIHSALCVSPRILIRTCLGRGGFERLLRASGRAKAGEQEFEEALEGVSNMGNDFPSLTFLFLETMLETS